MKNTDYRPHKNNNHNEFSEIKEVIAHFGIKNDLTIRSYDQEQETTISIDEDNNINLSNDDEVKRTTLSDKLSIDISNLCKEKDKYFIFVSISIIDDEDMRIKTKKEKNGNIDGGDMKGGSTFWNIKAKETKKSNGTTVIYRVELECDDENYKNNVKNNVVYRIIQISGICKFIHKPKSPSSESNGNNECFGLRRFLILNSDGINSFHYENNFSLYKIFDYPKSIEIELGALDSSDDRMNLLLSCIYDKYFLVEHYGNNVQSLEGSN